MEGNMAVSTHEKAVSDAPPSWRRSIRRPNGLVPPPASFPLDLSSPWICRDPAQRRGPSFSSSPYHLSLLIPPPPVSPQ
eukprot:954444-Rhodomonas_salina.1